MTQQRPVRRYRFGAFEADGATGELRRLGVRIKLNAQPFQVLLMLLSRPGELLTREEISRELWPEGTFVDFDHGVNSAVNRIREALGDTAGSPRFVETLARRGYRFVAPVERIGERIGERIALENDAAGPECAPEPKRPEPLPASPPEPISDHAIAPGPTPREPATALQGESAFRIGGLFLATPDELPTASPRVVQTLFVLFQLMYVGFYVGALANLGEIEDLLSPLPRASLTMIVLIVTAAILIPVRAFVLSAVLFHAPGARQKFLRLWPFLLVFDVLWALSPFLLLHHINFGLALACTVLLVYAPFAQRSLVLMGAGGAAREVSATTR
jgi:DNA-binding winged helix-turn-helix (wHTH) protein